MDTNCLKGNSTFMEGKKQRKNNIVCTVCTSYDFDSWPTFTASKSSR